MSHGDSDGRREQATALVRLPAAVLWNIFQFLNDGHSVTGNNVKLASKRLFTVWNQLYSDLSVKIMVKESCIFVSGKVGTTMNAVDITFLNSGPSTLDVTLDRRQRKGSVEEFVSRGLRGPREPYETIPATVIQNPNRTLLPAVKYVRTLRICCRLDFPHEYFSRNVLHRNKQPLEVDELQIRVSCGAKEVMPYVGRFQATPNTSRGGSTAFRGTLSLRRVLRTIAMMRVTCKRLVPGPLVVDIRAGELAPSHQKDTSLLAVCRSVEELVLLDSTILEWDLEEVFGVFPSAECVFANSSGNSKVSWGEYEEGSYVLPRWARRSLRGRQLRGLALPGCPLLTGSVLRKIPSDESPAVGCLTSLSLSKCPNLTADSFPLLMALVSKGALAHLDISGCQNLRAYDVSQQIVSCTAAETHLQTLIVDDSPWLCDQVLETIGTVFSSGLKAFSMARCHGISGDGFVHCFLTHAWPVLKRLSVADSIPTGAYRTVFSCSELLTQLHVCAWPQHLVERAHSDSSVSSIFLETLRMTRPGIQLPWRVLVLSGSSVVDTDVAWLPSKAPYLHTLVLANAPQLTMMGVMRALMAHPSVHCVFIVGCRNLVRWSVRSFLFDQLKGKDGLGSVLQFSLFVYDSPSSLPYCSPFNVPIADVAFPGVCPITDIEYL